VSWVADLYPGFCPPTKAFWEKQDSDTSSANKNIQPDLRNKVFIKQRLLVLIWVSGLEINQLTRIQTLKISTLHKKARKFNKNHRGPVLAQGQI